MERLAGKAQQLANVPLPPEVPRSWITHFIEHIAAKKIIAPALNSIVGGPMQLFEPPGIKIKDAIQFFAARAVVSGENCADLDPLGLLRTVVDVANVAPAA